MTRWRLALWAALLALSLAAVACGGGGSSTDEAVVFTSREGRFSAEFPSQPERTERTQTVAGIPLKLIFFGTDDEERAVQVGYIDYPPGIVTADPKTSLNGGAEGAAAAVNGRLTKKTPTTFLGHDAIDYVVEVEGGMLTAKAFLVGDRMYLLQEAGESRTHTGYDRLVSTFKLL